MLKAVLDTNILVSSLLVKAGLPAQIVDAWRERRYILVTSPDLIAEVRATLTYPRLRRKYPLTDERRRATDQPAGARCPPRAGSGPGRNGHSH